jgi:hypothetical protein
MVVPEKRVPAGALFGRFHADIRHTYGYSSEKLLPDCDDYH